MKHAKAGFTLVELLVVIVCTSIVTVAAMSFLLMGMRMTGASNDTAEQQQTVRILLTMLENLAGSGQIRAAEPQGSGWAVLDASDNTLLQYEDGAVTSGGGTVLIDGLKSSSMELEENLLTVTLRTEKAEYATSVYCRLGIKGESTVDAEETASLLTLTPTATLFTSMSGGSASSADAPASSGGETAGSSGEQSSDDSSAQPSNDPPTQTAASSAYESRLAFLAVLASQHGSGGEIKGASDEEYRYFSEWYIGGYAGNPGWNADTPWCACFVSWAAAQLGSGYLETVPRFSNVDDGKARFESGAIGTWQDRGYAPTPGDCIFFDWTGGDDPAHVGVVFYVDSAAERVYTIEGNSSGRVAIRSYALDDPRILGYGVLKWKTA